MHLLDMQRWDVALAILQTLSTNQNCFSTVAVTNHNVKCKALDTNMASKKLQDDMLVPKDGGFQVRK